MVGESMGKARRNGCKGNLLTWPGHPRRPAPFIYEVRGRYCGGGSGAVYIIDAFGTDLFKIGRTRRSISARIEDLQMGSPLQLRRRMEFNTKPGDEVGLEKFLHAHFEKYRRHGEWFELPSGWEDMTPELVWGFFGFDRYGRKKKSRSERTQRAVDMAPTFIKTAEIVEQEDAAILLAPATPNPSRQPEHHSNPS